MSCSAMRCEQPDYFWSGCSFVLHRMRVIDFKERFSLNLTKSTGEQSFSVPPGRSVILPTFFVNKLLDKPEFPPLVAKLSDTTGWFTPFRMGAARTGDSILLYNGSGGYGDQVMTWPVAKMLHDRGLKVSILCDPGNEVMWDRLPFIEQVLPWPLPLATAQLFDWVVLWDSVVNRDEHQSQPHPVDRMFFMLGLDPFHIHSPDKVVHAEITDAEFARAEKLCGGDDVAVYQLAASNELRSVKPEVNAKAITELVTKFPTTRWVVIADSMIPKHHTEVISQLDAPNLSLQLNVPLRTLLALAARAKVCVGPDSLLTHFAGVCCTPYVGIWGPTDPAKRCSYYLNKQVHLFEPRCPFMPCCTYAPRTPGYCPFGERCGVIDGVTADQIVAAVETTLSTANKPVMVNFDADMS